MPDGSGQPGRHWLTSCTVPLTSMCAVRQSDGPAARADGAAKPRVAPTRTNTAAMRFMNCAPFPSAYVVVTHEQPDNGDETRPSRGCRHQLRRDCLWPLTAAPSVHLLGNLRCVIDLRALRDDPDRFRRSQRARGADVGLVDAVVAADERRRG